MRDVQRLVFSQGLILQVGGGNAMRAQRYNSSLLYSFFQLNGHREQVCHLTNGLLCSICN